VFTGSLEAQAGSSQFVSTRIFRICAKNFTKFFSKTACVIGLPRVHGAVCAGIGLQQIGARA
jgi:hypothetical protein